MIGDNGRTTRDWAKLEAAVQKNKLTQAEREVALIHTGNILGRTFEEVLEAHGSFASKEKPEHFLHIIYWLGKLAMKRN